MYSFSYQGIAIWVFTNYLFLFLSQLLTQAYDSQTYDETFFRSAMEENVQGQRLASPQEVINFLSEFNDFSRFPINI